MGTSVRSSPSIVVRELQVKPPKSQWLSLVLRRGGLMPSTSPLTSMTSREMARLTPSTRRPHPCLQLEPHPEDHQGDRRWMRQGREVPVQARCLPLSWRRCALLRSKHTTLSLSSEYKKPPIFHHNVWSMLDERAEHQSQDIPL